MIVYSLLLTLALVASAPWWGWRMLTSGRYREGLSGRLGRLPAGLDETIAGRGAAAGLVWVHAVSVGEVLAVQRLVSELRATLPDHLLVVSTTTATGQKVAREKLGGMPVFYYPLDFAWVVRRYLRALRPSLFVTAESEFWPRMLVECERAGVPVAVVNARISDRSFPRYMRLRGLWRPLLGKVRLFLAQGEETADRLRTLGVAAERIVTVGNLKYEFPQVRANAVAERLRTLVGSKKLVVAGSTLAGEEDALLGAWPEVLRTVPSAVLVLAPRHPQRFQQVLRSAAFADLPGYCGGWTMDVSLFDYGEDDGPLEGGSVILLDTVGDLAAVYELATVAFVGGSLVNKGGHNPLEPARFGVPVVMGPSYQNFREIVEAMRAEDAISIVQPQELGGTLSILLEDDGGLGSNGRRFFNRQTGATQRAVAGLVAILEPGP